MKGEHLLIDGMRWNRTLPLRMVLIISLISIVCLIFLIYLGIIPAKSSAICNFIFMIIGLSIVLLVINIGIGKFILYENGIQFSNKVYIARDNIIKVMGKYEKTNSKYTITIFLDGGNTFVITNDLNNPDRTQYTELPYNTIIEALVKGYYPIQTG